jgi:pimeloyl-ACP methyl ester carboxylesterase
VAALYLPGTARAQTGVVDPAARSHCIVLLHGMARSARSMRPLARYFRSISYRVINVDYPSGEHKLIKLAQLAVGSGIDQCNKLGMRKIHIITHSLGGILVRQFLSTNTVPNLGRVVMLAPPNHGSEVVDEFGFIPGFLWLNGPVGRQLGTDEDSPPRALGPANFEVGIIAGTSTINPILSQLLPNPDDGKVSVYSAKLTGMCAFLTLPVSHPFIMRNKTVMFQSLRFIRTGRFTHVRAERWPRNGANCSSVAPGKPPRSVRNESETVLY